MCTGSGNEGGSTMNEMGKALLQHIYGLVVIVAFVFMASTAGVLIGKYIKWLWSAL